MKRTILLWVGLLSSAAFLYIALRGIAFDHFVDALRNVAVGPVLAAFAILVLVYFVRTVRWQRIIATYHPITMRQCFSILMIGFFANNVLPARAGEFVRAFLVRKEIKVGKSFALGTILVERMGDLAALLALLVVGLYRYPEETLPPIVAQVRRLAVILFILFVGGMWALLRMRRRALNLFRRMLGLFLRDYRAARATSKLDDFTRGIEILRNPRELAWVTVLSVLSWGMMAIIFLLVFRAFQFDLPFASAALTVALVNLGVIVPSSPGYVGTYEFFIVKSLGAFGIASGAALAFSLVTRLLWYLFETVVGFIALWSAHLPIRALFHISRAGEDVAARAVEPPSHPLPAAESGNAHGGGRQ